MTTKDKIKRLFVHEQILINRYQYIARHKKRLLDLDNEIQKISKELDKLYNDSLYECGPTTD